MAGYLACRLTPSPGWGGTPAEGPRPKNGSPRSQIEPLQHGVFTRLHVAYLRQNSNVKLRHFFTSFKTSTAYRRLEGF